MTDLLYVTHNGTLIIRKADRSPFDAELRTAAALTLAHLPFRSSIGLRQIVVSGIGPSDFLTTDPDKIDTILAALKGLHESEDLREALIELPDFFANLRPASMPVFHRFIDVIVREGVCCFELQDDMQLSERERARFQTELDDRLTSELATSLHLAWHVSVVGVIVVGLRPGTAGFALICEDIVDALLTIKWANSDSNWAAAVLPSRQVTSTPA